MAKIQILMPSMGESIMECTVLKWLINEGDEVTMDDFIIEVATDKIDTEIGSSHSGKITKFFVKEGELALIGKPICEIETADDDEVLTFSKKEIVEDLTQNIEQIKEKIQTENTLDKKSYSPLVQSIAKNEGIGENELAQIIGTGIDQRITKDDLLHYLKNRKTNSEAQPINIIKSTEIDQIVEMDRMRKMIAERMVESKRISPHVTSFIETDMTQLDEWRTANKNQFIEKYNENLTFTPLLIQAVVNAIKKYPAINVQVEGTKIIYKKDINIGMAVALPNGNLIVPVIHCAEQYNLLQLSQKVNDLANRARNNQLKPEELGGGTYTISNIGSFGNLAGTPIIMQPQVAIMAFGIIRKMPAVIETPLGDFIGIRKKMIISHSFDHRIVDGSLGGLFLKCVSEELENFDFSKSSNF